MFVVAVAVVVVRHPLFFFVFLAVLGIVFGLRSLRTQSREENGQQQNSYIKIMP